MSVYLCLPEIAIVDGFPGFGWDNSAMLNILEKASEGQGLETEDSRLWEADEHGRGQQLVFSCRSHGPLTRNSCIHNGSQDLFPSLSYTLYF